MRNRNSLFAIGIAVLIAVVAAVSFFANRTPQKEQPQGGIGGIAVTPVATPSSTPSASETPDETDVVGPALTYLGTIHSFDSNKPYPGYDINEVYPEVSGDLKKKVDLIKQDITDPSVGDLKSYSLLKARNQTTKFVPEKYVATRRDDNTYYVEVNYHLDVTNDALESTTSGSPQFSVITVKKVNGKFYAVSDDMPQGR